jgi:hypothetical protein
MKVALFDRHSLPENDGAICTGFDFESFSAVKSPLWDTCIDYLTEFENNYDHRELEVIVTGLTPALTQFLAELTQKFMEKTYEGVWLAGYSRKLKLLHFNAVTSQYVTQEFFLGGYMNWGRNPALAGQ